MRAILLLPAVALVIHASAQATDIPVAPGGSIQAAISVAADGDRILVQPGTYMEAIDFLSKSIKIQSVGGPTVTVIDAAGLGKRAVTINGGGSVKAIVEGFTVRNGVSATDGGGIFVNGASATIRRCVVRDCSAFRGGGIALGMVLFPFTVSVVEHCTIEANHATSKGGGIHVAPTGAEIRECSILDNTSGGEAGGVQFDGPSIIRSCEIRGNVATSRGGGIAVFDRNCRILACRVEENSALRGGGISYVNLLGSDVPTGLLAEATLIRANQAVLSGGGVYLQIGNLSSGISSSAWLQKCTLASNIAPVAAALEFVPVGAAPIPVQVRGSIVWDHPPGAIVAPPSAPFTVEFSDVEGGFPGTGNQNVDPLFVDLQGGDLHLRFGSLCIGAGIGFTGPGPHSTTDFEGDPLAAPLDQGADEFHRHLYTTGTFAPGAELSVRAIGLPGDPVLVLASGGLAATPLAIPGFGEILLALPLALPPLALPPIAPDGTTSIAIELRPSIAGATVAIQGVIGPQLSNAVVLEG